MDSNRNWTPSKEGKMQTNPQCGVYINYPKEMEPGTHQVNLTGGKHLKTLISIAYSKLEGLRNGTRHTWV